MALKPLLKEDLKDLKVGDGLIVLRDDGSTSINGYKKGQIVFVERITGTVISTRNKFGGFNGWFYGRFSRFPDILPDLKEYE